MLAYAAERPTNAARRSSPRSFLLIGAAHFAVIAAVMSAKMDLPSRILNSPIVVTNIPLPSDPPPPAPTPAPHRTSKAAQPTPTAVPRTVAIPNDVSMPPVIPTPALPSDIRFRPSVVPQPPIPVGETHGATLLTSGAALEPPYPRDKLLNDEEASLKLLLTIDEQGRVVVVEALLPADRSFLDSARKHLMSKWRYRPALKDGRPVRTTIITTLHFRLDG